MMHAADTVAMGKTNAGDDQNVLLLTAAQNNVDKKKYSAVITLLTASPLNNNLTEEQNVERSLLLAQAYAGEGNSLQALNYFSQAYTQSPANNQDLSLTIWRILQKMPLTTLSQLVHDKALSSIEPSIEPSIEQGWISLAIIHDHPDTLESYKQAISQWMITYPNHPALAFIDQKQLQQSISTVKHITLLLPLTGPFAQSGQAIRNAFFAAYYQDHNHSQPAPTITVLDTYQNSVQDLYQQAVSNGSDFVVGPLLKNNVDAIASLSQLPIPVLALNATSFKKIPSNFYSFSLSPVQEAAATAQYAFAQNNAPHAITIIPNNDWGSNIAKAFETQWQQLGGQVISSMTYQNREDLYQSIKDLLRYDLSQNRINSVENTLGKKVRATPTIRQDINCIFIVAEPSMARQIAPLLKFYYADNIPTYTTSTIYDGTPNSAAYNDMNGLIFIDMPFVLSENPKENYPFQNIKNQLQALYPKSFMQNIKLYALGLDAYLLTQELPQLRLTPLLSIDGATGALTLNADQSIHRQLLWVQMTNGSPKLLPA